MHEGDGPKEDAHKRRLVDNFITQTHTHNNHTRHAQARHARSMRMRRMDPVDTRTIPTCSREGADIVLAITACADVLKPVHFPLFPLHGLPQVIDARMVMHTPSFVNAGSRVAMASLASKRSLNRRVQDRAKSPRRGLPTVVGHQERSALWCAQCWRRPARCRALSERHSRACSFRRIVVVVPQGPALRRGDRHARRLARLRSEPTGVKLIDVVERDAVLLVAVFVRIAKQQVRQGIEPRFVSLARRGCEPDPTARADHFQAPAVQTRWVRVVIRHHPHSFDGNALRLKLGLTGMLRVLLTPIQGTGVRVDPEVPAMSRARHLIRNRLPCVLPQELANHSLCDCLDHARIGTLSIPIRHHASETAREHVEPLVDLRCK